MAAWTKKKKIIVALVGAVVVGGLAIFGATKQRKSKKAPVPAVVVKTGSVIEQLKETGRIEFVRTVEVKSTVSGEIASLLAEPGGIVEQGNVIAMIKPDRNQTLQLYNKRAAVDRVRIDLDQIRKDLTRKKQLHKNRLISEEEVERAGDQLEKALNAFHLAQLELETLEININIERGSGTQDNADAQQMDDVRILSPASGVVIDRPVEVGEVVVSGILSTVTGTRLFEIGDPSQMMVKADISEVDVGRLEPGQHVKIIVDAYPDTTYKGIVHRIAPVGLIKPGSSIVTFHTEIRILDREPRLRQGMSCDIDIIFARHDSTRYLPVGSVYEQFDDDAREGDKKGERGRFIVYKKVDDDFEEVEIQIGLMPDTRIEILDGLAEGDSVAAQAEKVYKKREKEKKKTAEPDSTQTDSAAADTTQADTTQTDTTEAQQE